MKLKVFSLLLDVVGSWALWSTENGRDQLTHLTVGKYIQAFGKHVKGTKCRQSQQAKTTNKMRNVCLPSNEEVKSIMAWNCAFQICPSSSSSVEWISL